MCKLRLGALFLMCYQKVKVFVLKKQVTMLVAKSINVAPFGCIGVGVIGKVEPLAQ